MSDNSRWAVKLDADRFGPWAVVTGASSGIGREFARQLAASGINVVLVSRRSEVLEQVGETLKQRYGVAFRTIVADLSTEQGVSAVKQRTSDLDVGLLVSNAGAGHPGNFLAFDEAELRATAQLNALSYMVLTHHFSRRFVQRGKGATLLVSALGADTGIPFNAHSAATKALVTVLGRSIHAELRPFGVGVTVLIVTPTETPIIDKMGLRSSAMPMKPMTVAQCVGEGLAGLRRNRMTVLPGRLYRIMNRLMPAGLVRSMTANMMRQSTKFVS
ncbi:MAG TPA: SDR family NAD(P)-dependent oxidoreductase [Devosia sp.]|jgi:hypothetical protein|nr:SDR family NAD(P)-dependent oxidoreductase [Devosia sp.]